MKYDLQAAVKRAGKIRRKTYVLPDIRPRLVDAEALARIYYRVPTLWLELWQTRLRPVYERTLSELVGDTAADMNAALDEATGFLTRLVAILTPNLKQWALDVEEWHRGRWGAALTPTGVNPATMLSPLDVDSNDVNIPQTIEQSVEWNVNLIRARMVDDVRAKVSDAIFAGFQNRTPTDEVARTIREALGVSRQRARRIAGDQLAKLSSALDRERMLQAGIYKYEWRWSRKVYPREWHKARDGNKYLVAGDPAIPRGDGCGEPPFCGCRRRAVLDLA